MGLQPRFDTGRARRKNAAAGALLAALVCACAGPGELARDGGAEKANAPRVELGADLVYDLLLADIAMQRGRERVALDAYTRAARQTRDRALAKKALLLAMHLKAHERAAELTALFAELDAESRGQSPEAAGFAGSREELALRLLADIARAHPEQEDALREIAEMLTEQARLPGHAHILPRFREISARWPEEAALHWIAALLATELDEREAALESADAALRFRPGWESPAMLKLSLLAETSVAAVQDFAGKFLRAHPRAARARIHYGQLLLRAEYTEASLEQFDKALAQRPNSPAALLFSGVAQTRLRRPEKALAPLRKLLAAYPQHDQARLYISEAELARDNFDAADEVLRGISSPQYRLDAQFQYAAVAAARDGVDAGIARLAQLQPGGEGERVRIVMEHEALFRKHGAPQRALAVFDRALAETPKQADLLYQRGILAAQLDLLELHERDMRAVLQLQPENAHAYNALGYTLADRTARFAEARELIARALELLPNDPFILDSMGWVQFRLGRHKSAISYLRRALDIRRDAETAAHLGEALWVSGKRREAREIWTRGREWSPDNTTLQDTIERLWRDASLRAPAAAARAG
ncbi:MAG: tetratricopeptide repeat protein [Gammaproteobacteria bacterium]|nr:tetratricopeptide repeat protein [Gammaproteobacteria bacterium]